MGRFKTWLCNRFLPAYCRDELLTENQGLRQTVEAQRQKLDRLNAYLDGVESAARWQRRIVIQTGGTGIERGNGAV